MAIRICIVNTAANVPYRNDAGTFTATGQVPMRGVGARLGVTMMGMAISIYMWRRVTPMCCTQRCGHVHCDGSGGRWEGIYGLGRLRRDGDLDLWRGERKLPMLYRNDAGTFTATGQAADAGRAWPGAITTGMAIRSVCNQLRHGQCAVSQDAGTFTATGQAADAGVGCGLG